MNIRRLEKNIVSYSNSHYQNISASLLKEDDLAIAVSTSGKTNCVVRSLKIAKSNGVNTIAITSNQNFPLTEHADIILLITFSEPLLMKETNSSIVEQMTLLSALNCIGYERYATCFYYFISIFQHYWGRELINAYLNHVILIMLIFYLISNYD